MDQTIKRVKNQKIETMIIMMCRLKNEECLEMQVTDTTCAPSVGESFTYTMEGTQVHVHGLTMYKMTSSGKKMFSAIGI